MGVILNADDLVNRITGGAGGTPQSIFFIKHGRNATGATSNTTLRWSSLWRNYGFPAHGAAPGAVAAPDNTTAGSLLQASPGVGRQQWLLNASFNVHAPASALLYDRLLHVSGLDGTVTTNQNVGGSLTRYTDGVGNQIWVEIYTQIGATSRNITATYTNQAGQSKTTPSTTIGNTNFREATRMIPLSLAAGDTGVQGVTSVILDNSTGTAGDFGVTVVHPMVLIPMSGSGAVGSSGTALYSIRDLIGEAPSLSAVSSAPGVVEVKSGACLTWMVMPLNTIALESHGALHMVES